MHHQKINFLLEALQLNEISYEPDPTLKMDEGLIKGKEQNLLQEVYQDLGGQAEIPLLKKLKFDFQINRFLFLYDDAHHFNRYRLTTLKAGLYEIFSYPWHQNYLRLCRAHERECLLSGLQERVWNGPPLAGIHFGPSESPGELSGTGSAGWKLNAYNDFQYDLISRLQGYKVIRVPAYENLMIGGSLKRIDQLLLRPNETILKALGTWLTRKMI